VYVEELRFLALDVELPEVSALLCEGIEAVFTEGLRILWLS